MNTMQGVHIWTQIVNSCFSNWPFIGFLVDVEDVTDQRFNILEDQFITLHIRH